MFFETESIIKANDEYELTKSETERFLISLNLPTCQCMNLKQRTTDTTAKHSSFDDTSMNISMNDSFSQPLNKKKNKPTPTKGMSRFSLISRNWPSLNTTECICSLLVVSRRTRYYPLKSARNAPTKHSRQQDQSPSNRQLMSVIQSLKTSDLQDDSSFDFFDMDTTFSDPYDRFFSDTTTSEKSIC